MPGKYLQSTPQAGSTDTVPAMLTPGEFVNRKDAADEIGRDKLHAMNNIDRLSGMSAITSYKPPQFQEGGEVMNYFGGGMVRNAGAGYQEGGAVDTLKVFGDKSRSADDLSAMAAMEMMKAQRPSPAEKGHMDFIEEAIRRRKAEREYQGPPIPEYLQPQPASELEIRPPSAPAPEMIPRMQQGGMVPPPMQQQGMVPPPIPQQGLPPAGFMQEGGVVRQPMPTGEPAGMEESPVPQGERTYAEQPMDQLGMEPHEYDSYVENGPERYKYLAPKYKQQTQWTPYDAMVDAGIIDPYEHDKDDFVIMARDQANALREA